MPPQHYAPDLTYNPGRRTGSCCNMHTVRYWKAGECKVQVLLGKLWRACSMIPAVQGLGYPPMPQVPAPASGLTAAVAAGATQSTSHVKLSMHWTTVMYMEHRNCCSKVQEAQVH